VGDDRQRGISVLAGIGFIARSREAGSVTIRAGYAALGGFFLVSALCLRRAAGRAVQAPGHDRTLPSSRASAGQ
jgi:hypothetical protein